MESEKCWPCGRWGLHYSRAGNAVSKRCLNSASVSCTLTSLQEIPSTCRDALTLTITRSCHGDSTDASCGGSVCVVTQDAHRINLRIFRDGTLFAVDSVYVPAVGASECCLQTDSPQPVAHKWLNTARTCGRTTIWAIFLTPQASLRSATLRPEVTRASSWSPGRLRISPSVDIWSTTPTMGVDITGKKADTQMWRCLVGATDETDRQDVMR